MQYLTEKGDLSLNDIKIIPTEGSKLKSEVGSAVISHDIIGLSAIDKSGKDVHHRIIYEIDAHSKKEFRVEVNAEKLKEKSIISFKIVHADKEPAQVVSFDPFNFCKKNNKDFNTYYDTGQEMLNQNRFNEAIICYEKAIRVDPKSAKAYTNLGNAFHFSGNDEKAMKMYTKAIKLDEKLPQPYVNLAVMLMNQGKYKEAMEKLKKVVEIDDPLKLEAYGLWGACLEQLGQYEEAIEKYNEIIKLAPKSAAAEKSRNSLKELNKKGNL